MSAISSRGGSKPKRNAAIAEKENPDKGPQSGVQVGRDDRSVRLGQWLFHAGCRGPIAGLAKESVTVFRGQRLKACG